MLFPFSRQFRVSDRKADGHGEQNDLHRSNKHVDKPRAPARETDPEYHVYSKYPSILRDHASVWKMHLATYRHAYR
jgi:hypothetical protein